LNARGLYAKRAIEFRPQYLLCLMTNSRPRAAASDVALWNRIVLIPFDISFVDEPKRNERKADPTLPSKLRAEASGILAWLVRGCLAYQKQGLKPPEKVKVATAEYQKAEDTIGQFIEERCVCDQKCEVKAGQLYKTYKGWCDDNGHRAISGTRFGREIKRHFDSYKDSRGVSYLGIGLLKPEYPE